MSGAYSFVCLDPRKAKRAAIDQLLSPGGQISWLRMPPLSTRPAQDVDAAALEALEMSKDRRQSAARRNLHLRLLRLQYNGTYAYFKRRPGAVAVCWNGLNGSRRIFMQAAKAAGARTLFFELAPFPGRITVDPRGVNYHSSLPRHIAPYLLWHEAHDPVDWRALGRTITQRAPLTSVASGSDAPPLDESKFIFVPLQTPGDSQLRLFGGAFRTVPEFIKGLAEAASALPDGWHIRIKEHPTAPESFAEQILTAAPGRVFLDNSTDTFTQVAAGHAVMTVNSSVGLEAMFYDKPVIACGQCFWAIDGVAETAPTMQDIARLVKAPENLRFDVQAREAFLSFMDAEYYPRQADPGAFAQIAGRLSGKNAHGFWEVSA